MANLLSTGTAYAGPFNDAILSSTGAPVTNTPVTVYQSDGTTSATIYSDQNRTSQTNPVNTDSYGNLLFFADPGYYVLSFTVGGVGSTKNVQINPWYADAAWNVVAGVSTNTAMISGDSYLVSSGSPTMTLPAPALGARVLVTNYGSGTVTVLHNASEVIYGLGMTSAGVSSFLLATYGATATLESDGTNWFVTSGQQDSGWIVVGSGGSAPAFGTNWSSLGGAFFGPAFRLSGNIVRLRGIFSGTAAANSTAFTLPSGYRPSSSIELTQGASGGTNPGIVITSGGLVQPTAQASATPGLDGCFFSVD